MKNTRRTNIIDRVLDEYVNWGGPIITRREVLADVKAKGFSAREIDILVFGRTEVPAPADPAAHSAMHAQIVAMGW